MFYFSILFPVRALSYKLSYWLLWMLFLFCYLLFHYIVHVVPLQLQVPDVLSYGAKFFSTAPLFLVVIVIAPGDILPP